MKNKPINAITKNWKTKNSFPANGRLGSVSCDTELKNQKSENQLSIKDVPKDQRTEWDIESLKRVREILAIKKAEEFRKNIARIMHLAGVSYEIEKKRFYRKLNITNGMEGAKS